MGGWSQAEGTAVAQVGLVCFRSKYGSYRENGKENGNYCILYWGYTGIMERTWKSSPKRMWDLYSSAHFVASFV